MAKTSQFVKSQRVHKFKTRNYNRCKRCGRSRAYTRCRKCGRPRAVYKKFGLCRICLRELAHDGYIPGMTKSSW